MPAVDIAAALAKLVQGKTPLLLQAPPEPSALRAGRGSERRRGHPRAIARRIDARPPRHERPAVRAAAPRHPRRPANAGEALFADDKPATAPAPRATEVGMETFRIEVGHAHGVQPGNIVGAIANEADLESRYIGRIDIRDDYSLVDLPEGMPRELMEHLKKVRVAGQALRIQRAAAGRYRARRVAASARTRARGAAPARRQGRMPPGHASRFKPRPPRGG